MPLLFFCEVFGAVRVPKEMWVICSLLRAGGRRVSAPVDGIEITAATAVDDELVAAFGYVRQQGDGPFGDCEWTPPVGPGQAYF